MNEKGVVIKDIRIVYFWYHHFNPKVNERKIEVAINNHDWKTFEKWLEWQKEQDFVYFPESAVVYINGEYYGELIINEDNFNLITENDYECG